MASVDKVNSICGILFVCMFERGLIQPHCLDFDIDMLLISVTLSLVVVLLVSLFFLSLVYYLYDSIIEINIHTQGKRSKKRFSGTYCPTS